MNKKIVFTAILISCFFVGTISANAQSTVLNSTGCVQLTQDFGFGARDRNTNGQVSVLQNFLINQSHLIGPATGYFGNGTRSALAKFQAAQGISPALGYLGPVTRAKIAALTCNSNQSRPPQINSMSPTSGYAGVAVNLYGSSFTISNNINFGSTVISNVASTDGITLTFSVPNLPTASSLGSSFPVSVTNVRGTSNTVLFNLLSTPASSTGGRLSINSDNSATSYVTLVQSGPDYIGQFTWTFPLTAIDGDVWVSPNGAVFAIYNSSGINTTQMGNAVSSFGISSGQGSIDNGFFHLKAGETATFSLLVNYQPTADGYYKMRLQDIYYNNTGPASPNNKLVPTEFFDTNTLYVPGSSPTTAVNHPPQITGGYAPTSPLIAGQSYGFGWSATDQDNDDLSWGVIWGDGSGLQGACQVPHQQNKANWNFTASHSWNSPGTYSIYINVSDCMGGVSSSTAGTYSVIAPPAPISTAPTITSISPSSGPVGSQVTIKGTNYNSRTFVAIDGDSYTVFPNSYTSTSLTFTVPNTISIGTHKIQVNEIAAAFPLSNAVSFTVTAPDKTLCKFCLQNSLQSNALNAFNQILAVVVNGHSVDNPTSSNDGTVNPNGPGTNTATNSTIHVAPSLSVNMHIGSTDTSTNGEVSLLQQFLVGGGYLTMPAGVSTGYFGPLTQAAVIQFQTAAGISPNVGFVGPITRSVIQNLTGGNGSNSSVPAYYSGNGATNGTTTTTSNCFTQDCSRSTNGATTWTYTGPSSTTTGTIKDKPTGSSSCPTYASCGAQPIDPGQ
jgi:peptidoglycan hydrolase-like protein with peptidoglycan-binding domain